MLTRPQYQFQNSEVVLSIQASEFHYCQPRKDLPCLGDYTSVEMAIFPKDGGDFLRPSELGIEGYDDLWVGDEGAGYVPYDRAMALLEAMNAKFGEKDQLLLPPNSL